jgi:hypothetical protein
MTAPTFQDVTPSTPTPDTHEQNQKSIAKLITDSTKLYVWDMML